MKCEICKKEFDMSLEWLKMNNYNASLKDNKHIFCNDCVMDILKSRKYNLENELNNLNLKILNIEGGIYE